jgi:cytochrome b561
MAGSDQRYGAASVVLHWAMLVLLIGVYACIELREIFPRGSDPRAALKTWHFMLGLTVFALVWIRMAARLLGRTPPIAPPIPVWQRVFANAVELALYVLMIILPLLGGLTLSAAGDPIPFFALQLPPLVPIDEALAERMEDLHTTLGTTGYFLIGIHATAALYHHYVRRDDTLRRMTL